MYESINQLNEVIKTNNKFIITCHENPDGDALGASNALAFILQSLNKDTLVIYPEDIPKQYQFLDRPEKWAILNEDYMDGEQKITGDVVITLDSSSVDRVERVVNRVNHNVLVNIDHHQTNTLYGDLNLVDSQSSSTCEFLLEILNFFQQKLNLSIAKNLYTGIFTDTGSFNYENVSQTTFDAAKQLISYGVKPYEISREIHEKMSLNLFHFMREVLNDLKLTRDQKIGWIVCSRRLISKYDILDSELEGLINHVRVLEPVEFAVIFKETREGLTKVGFRSKTKDVSRVASELGGGGHARAAGCLLEMDPNKSVELVISKLKTELEL
ncbi:DHH family phosphoesterase [Natranaerobius thermophilus]|uniref:Phosphoesterase RecJ domain protein n=1 Tax=Natranaerobius thermophilus (strain ATCC BAA-1301 / DSM 18059 / JW/NM-WN-LF) TaxID=457570 RepID=B2A399_NATTJ|nr:bifunctional oligoribonuclease/PAP phosphatase NrnA [Natranaerobius thermophilus]ACB85029.1 phosphoesterase RecJ domain protein [Natranaerobius thermophilus JW/NM-WN-LF]